MRGLPAQLGKTTGLLPAGAAHQSGDFKKRDCGGIIPRNSSGSRGNVDGGFLSFALFFFFFFKFTIAAITRLGFFSSARCKRGATAAAGAVAADKAAGKCVCSSL